MNEQEMIQLLMDVMAVPSVNGRDNEGKVAEYLCNYFKEAGITSSVQYIDDTHANVVAYLEGEDPSEMEVWNGHLDTVPYGSLSDWHTDPAVPVIDQAGEKLYGRGASDMKSGLCAMVFALCAHKKSGNSTPHPILFIGTCDEEKNGIGAEYIRKHNTIGECRRILIGEPTGLKLGMAQKGCIWMELQVHGKTCHGAYPEQGCNAAEHAWSIAHELKNWVESFSHPLLGNSTANVTKIIGGTAPNMIPETCTVLMDIRVVPGVTVQMVQEKAEQLIRAEEEKTSGVLTAQTNILNNRRAIEISETATLTWKMEQCLRKEGLEPDYTGINFFTDASVIARDLPEAEVLLFGPGEPSMAHKPDEYVLLGNYVKAVHVFRRMIGETFSETAKKG